MKRTRTWRVAVVLVVAAVALSGCLGGGGDSSADPTPTPADPAGPGEGSSDPGDGATGDSGEGGDGGVGTDSGAGTPGSDGDGPVSTAAPGGTATPTPDMTATPTAPTATPTATPTGATPTPEQAEDPTADEFSAADHAAALRAAGSYTIEFAFTGYFGSGASGVTSWRGIEQVDLTTGERFASVDTAYGGRNQSMAYYVPPGAETAYRHIRGQTMTVPVSSAVMFDLADPGTGQSSDEWPTFHVNGSGQTDMGSATIYEVTNVSDLPSSTHDEYDRIEAVDFTIWVDDDTGLIVKYDYQLTFVDEGARSTARMTLDVSDVGSTTVQKPDWAP